METDDNLIPTGKLIDVTKTPFDLQNPVSLSQLSLDHVYTDLSREKFPYLDYTQLKEKITFKSSDQFGHVVIFTGNNADQFVCVENQTCSTDAINLYSEGYVKESGLRIVNPHDTDTGYIEYVFEEYE